MQFDREVTKNLNGGHFHTMWIDLSNKKDEWLTSPTLTWTSKLGPNDPRGG